LGHFDPGGGIQHQNTQSLARDLGVRWLMHGILGVLGVLAVPFLEPRRREGLEVFGVFVGMLNFQTKFDIPNRFAT